MKWRPPGPRLNRLSPSTAIIKGKRTQTDQTSLFSADTMKTHILNRFVVFFSFFTREASTLESSLFAHPMHETHRRFRRNSNVQIDQCLSASSTVGCNITTMLGDILKGYDKRFRPYEGEEHPVVVTVGMNILRLGNINEVNMDYNMDLHLIQVCRVVVMATNITTYHIRAVFGLKHFTFTLFVYYALFVVGGGKIP